MHVESPALVADLRRLSREAGNVLPVKDLSFTPEVERQAETEDVFAETAKESIAMMSPGMAKAMAMAALEWDVAPERTLEDEAIEKSVPHALVLPVLAVAQMRDAIRDRSMDELEQALFSYEQSAAHLTEEERAKLDTFLSHHVDAL